MNPGGGQDLYGRVLAPYLGRHLPGHPGIVVDNMPGAGGLIAADYLAARAEPDGLTIGLLGVQAVLAQLVSRTASFDVRDLPLIGSPAGDGAVCVFSRTSGFTLDAWRHGRVPRLGMTSHGSTTAAYAFLVSAALHVRLRPVIGYGGTSDIKAAIGSGEVDGLCLSQSSFVASFQPLEQYALAVQVGGGEARALADVPQAADLVTTDRARQLLGVASMVGQLARFLALPPRTPAARVNELRAAFEATMKDPDFLAAAAAAHLDVDVQSAATLGARVQELLALPPDVRRDVLAALEGAP